MCCACISLQLQTINSRNSPHKPTNPHGKTRGFVLTTKKRICISSHFGPWDSDTDDVRPKSMNIYYDHMGSTTHMRANLGTFIIHTQKYPIYDRQNIRCLRSRTHKQKHRHTHTHIRLRSMWAFADAQTTKVKALLCVLPIIIILCAQLRDWIDDESRKMADPTRAKVWFTANCNTHYMLQCMFIRCRWEWKTSDFGASHVRFSLRFRLNKKANSGPRLSNIAPVMYIHEFVTIGGNYLRFMPNTFLHTRKHHILTHTLVPVWRPFLKRNTKSTHLHEHTAKTYNYSRIR